MKNLFVSAAIITSVTAGWLVVAMRTPTERPAIKLEPITHNPYDPAAIDRNRVLHEARVKRDPTGPIGWSMLTESWLARSRESDLDCAAFKAEACARKSISLREDGNFRAKADLIDSLLEQHRFQDACKTLESWGFKTRQYGDVLIEMGRFAEADKVLRGLPLQNEDPSLIASRAHLALVQGDTDTAIKLLEKGLQLNEDNAGVSQPTIAWFETKLADACRHANQNTRAESLLKRALNHYPRSYKANLALAEMAAERKDWNVAIDYANKTLAIANSLDAHAIIGDAQMALGKTAEASKTYAACHKQYLDEIAYFDGGGHGGSFHVKPIDRQFANFCVRHKMFVREGLEAAKRDLVNRPDATAHRNVEALAAMATQVQS